MRENLHGHNYYVSAEIEALVDDNGLTCDYRIYKKKILALCAQLDLRFLLPAYSKYLKLEDTGDMWLAHFNNEKIPFLKRDILILPVTNISIEELSNWFLQQLIENPAELIEYRIQRIKLSVYNGPGQSGSAIWQK